MKSNLQRQSVYRARTNVRFLTFLAIGLVLSGSLRGEDELTDKRVTEVQVVGTHNSYHVVPDEVAYGLIKSVVPDEALANAYSHATLTEQLTNQRVRHMELDLFLDPKGGMYSEPAALKIARSQEKAVPAFDPDRELDKPGIKVLHSPDFEYRTTVYTFSDALHEVNQWSDQNKNHFPIFLLLELKSESFSPLTRPLPWNEDALSELEREILAVVPSDKIFRPDDLRGDYSSLREAVLQEGWPSVQKLAGKFVFLMDNEGIEVKRYLAKNSVLAGRLLFVSVPTENPAAAFCKRNDPIGSFEEIQRLVKQGFLVRTRADASTVEARNKDTARRERAFASGAQLISTDFPVENPDFPGYSVGIPDGKLYRESPK